jgi:hypothetical protein
VIHIAPVKIGSHYHPRCGDLVRRGYPGPRLCPRPELQKW